MTQPTPPKPPDAPRDMTDPEWAGRMTMAFAQGAFLPFAVLFTAPLVGEARKAASPVYAALEIAVNTFVHAFLSSIAGGLLFAIGIFACARALGWRRASPWRARAAGFVFVVAQVVLRDQGIVTFSEWIWQITVPPLLALVFIFPAPSAGDPK